ncbi:MAG: UbiA family prenyltransferase [Phycisphaerales bacterium]|nr:UbiA family prenyltransferase [Phycisphaerales bacterium]
MRTLLRKISPALHLTRVTTAFAAAANVWFVILWTHASGTPHEPGFAALRAVPVWVLLVGGAVNAVGLYSFAMAMNDVMDFRRDQKLNPNRPIPSGRLSLERAINVVAISLGMSVLGATVLGIPAVVLTLVLAGAVLMFNGAGKYVPAIGMLLLGLLYAGQMAVPNLNVRFVWPIWLVMTHALAVEGLRQGLGGRATTISRRAVVFTATGWVFWSLVILSVGAWRNRPVGERWWRGWTMWPDWVDARAAVGPALLVVVFGVWVLWKERTLGRGPRLADKIARYGALWLSLYACAWLLGQGYREEATVLGGLSLAGFLGMTVLREAYALFEHPIGYRR